MNMDNFSKEKIADMFLKLKSNHNVLVNASERLEHRNSKLVERNEFLELQLEQAQEAVVLAKRSMTARMVEANAKEQSYIKEIQELKDHIISMNLVNGK